MHPSQDRERGTWNAICRYDRWVLEKERGGSGDFERVRGRVSRLLGTSYAFEVSSWDERVDVSIREKVAGPNLSLCLGVFVSLLEERGVLKEEKRREERMYGGGEESYGWELL